MRYLSVCSGIEAATVAWHSLGWTPVAFAETEAFPSAVLAHHYPTVPNLGDITKHEDWKLGSIDLLVGGTPCQSFSVAGLRRGLADPRGNLTLVFLGILEQFRPHWMVWENVPGVLSDSTGAFGSFLGGLAELGFAYRILDAQYHGVAQRRRRVFVVGHSGGNWKHPAAVLFERESLLGHNPPSRQTGQRPAHTISARTKGGGGLGTDFDLDWGVIAGTIESSSGRTRGAGISPGSVIPIQEITKRQSGTPENGVGHGKPGDPMFTLQATAQHGVCAPIAVGIDGGQTGFALRADASHSGDKGDGGVNTTMVATGIPDVAYALQERDSKGSDSSTKDGHLLPMSRLSAVRRLTPTEAARLQGFPDTYLDIVYRGKPACDGPKYKALGNSFAVPVVHWIGIRIQHIVTTYENPT